LTWQTYQVVKQRFVEQSSFIRRTPAFLPPLFLLPIPKALPESSFPLSNWIGAY